MFNQSDLKFLLFLFVFVLLGCNKVNRPTLPEEFINANTEWVGRKVIFKKTLKPLDSLGLMNRQSNTYFTIVSYYDGRCSLCFLELLKWNKEIASFKNYNVSYKFILSSQNFASLELNVENIKFPKKDVFYDKNNDFQNNYPFFLDRNYVNSSILLDSNDRILLIGNPFFSKDIYNKYMTIMKGED